MLGQTHTGSVESMFYKMCLASRGGPFWTVSETQVQDL
jgi:hypothetical protein